MGIHCVTGRMPTSGVGNHLATGMWKMNTAKSINILKTSDRLKKLWLVNVSGYTLISTRRLPQSGMFGNIRYKNVWVLEKKENAAA